MASDSAVAKSLCAAKGTDDEGNAWQCDREVQGLKRHCNAHVQQLQRGSALSKIRVRGAAAAPKQSFDELTIELRTVRGRLWAFTRAAWCSAQSGDKEDAKKEARELRKRMELFEDAALELRRLAKRAKTL